uniref:Uncharacterized protein n=1 Tax=Anguilla anguilla TaxID=7936 RepID=A0A0E9R1E7_ANGAN
MCEIKTHYKENRHQNQRQANPVLSEQQPR